MLKISFLILISVGISLGCNRPWNTATTHVLVLTTTTPTITTTNTCNGYFWSNGRFKRCTFTSTITTTPLITTIETSFYVTTTLDFYSNLNWS
jgi:hypothetical protein